MENPKILQLCAIDRTVDSFLKPLIVKSMEEGYEVHTACTDTGKFEELEAEGLQMAAIPIDRSIHPIKNVKTIIHLYKLIKKEQYDIVHVHTPVAALLGRIAAKLAGTKHIIYTAHGFYFHDGMKKNEYRLFFGIEKFAAKWWTDWLLLQSREDYQLALDERFKLTDRTIHLSNGVDIWNKFHKDQIAPEDLETVKKELEIQEGDVVFSFIGRLVQEKGIFELVEAFKQAAEEHPNIKLIVIGGLTKTERDQESYGKLVEQMEHPGIKALGFREDIPLLMALSDAYILPSHREGLPRSIIEAMAMEKPIIATDIRGCREQVFPWQNGLLVEKENAVQLAESIKLLAKDEELRTNFSKKSRAIAEELFDEEKVLEKQLDLFRMLTAKPAEVVKKRRAPITNFSMRAAELVFATLLLFLLSPIFLGIALLIKLDSAGPVFFKQERGGAGGRHFLIYKFRTMYHNHPKGDLDIKVLATDERITKIGYFLRKTSLDELPQLFNILKGEMTFVGPRPALTTQTDNYDDYQKRRLAVKPGVTGLAQINGRNALSWEEKIALDIDYVQKKCLKFDLYILLQTAYVVLKSEGVYEDSLK
ncbi:sugar transferase [Planococcus sp. YIM B11945]|uniref:sugar transferase n=1 Tax=Planococcus sp. YIM B11945 TaxID=3435410 RepID=UPI003D7F0546